MAGMTDITTYVLAMAWPKVAPRPRPAVAKMPPGVGKGGHGAGGSGDARRRSRSRTPPAVRVMRWLEQPGMGDGAGGEEAAFLSVGLPTAEARTLLSEQLRQILQTPGRVRSTSCWSTTSADGSALRAESALQ